MKAEIPQFRESNLIFSQFEDSPEKGNLFLGNPKGLRDQVVEALKIGAVLTIMDEYMYGKYTIAQKISERGIKYHLHLIEDDDEEVDISRHFEQAHNFIQGHLKNTNVFVHCQAGVSRSATIVVSFMMKKLKLKAEEATKYVRTRRYVISPNQGFRKSLQKYEQELKQQWGSGSKIPQFDPKFGTEDFNSKYCNHIACFNSDGSEKQGNLFLGQATAVSDIYINKFKIKSVLTLLDDGFYNRLQIGPKIQHLNIPAHKWIKIRDSIDADILEKLEECHNFISQNLTKGNVLVHCQMGVSRSASVVVSYLMKTYKTDYYDAFYHVQQRRPQVRLNSSFEQQIKSYEKMLK